MLYSSIHFSSRNNKVAHVSELLWFQGCFWIRKSAETTRGMWGQKCGDCPLSRKREWLVLWLSPTEPCNLNFTDPEADVKILQHPGSAEECNYLVTVYLGYGIEVQVSAKAFLMAGLKTTPKVMNKQTPAWLFFFFPKIIHQSLSHQQLWLTGEEATAQWAAPEQHEGLFRVTILSDLFAFHLWVLPSLPHKE